MRLHQVVISMPQPYVCMDHSLLLRLPDAACLHCAASNSVEVWDIYSGLRLRIVRVQIPEETDMYVSAGVMHGKQVRFPAALTLYSMQTVANVSAIRQLFERCVCACI